MSSRTATTALRRALADPRTRDLDLDDPKTTRLRREIIEKKPFLKRIYEEWYRGIARQLPDGAGVVVELGSGAGFLKDFVPSLITSEVFYCEGVTLAVDGMALPFRDASLRGIVMTNVLHHIPQVARFLKECERCLRPGGRIVAVEPWVSAWSRWVYRNLHHEPFDPESPDWTFTGSGPLSSANGALPWMVFARDRARFEAEFPALGIVEVEGIMPFRYLICGGISMRNLMPAATFPLWTAIDRAVPARTFAMFARITIERQ